MQPAGTAGAGARQRRRRALPVASGGGAARRQQSGFQAGAGPGAGPGAAWSQQEVAPQQRRRGWRRRRRRRWRWRRRSTRRGGGLDGRSNNSNRHSCRAGILQDAVSGAAGRCHGVVHASFTQCKGTNAPFRLWPCLCAVLCPKTRSCFTKCCRQGTRSWRTG